MSCFLNHGFFPSLSFFIFFQTSLLAHDVDGSWMDALFFFVIVVFAYTKRDLGTNLSAFSQAKNIEGTDKFCSDRSIRGSR